MPLPYTDEQPDPARGSDPDDFDTVPKLDSGPGRVERVLRAVVMMAMVVLVVLAATDRLGMRTDSTSATAGGLHLSVEYPAVTRPGLPSPLRVAVTTDDGRPLPSQLVLRINSAYLSLFDQVQPSPQPSDATATADITEWTFDAAEDSRTLGISIDAALKSSSQTGRSARLAVVQDGRETTVVRFHTRVLP
jgi:hypothetical protein